MLRVSKWGNLKRFHFYKYVGVRTYGVKYIMGNHKKALAELIALVMLDEYIYDKGPTPGEIERIIFREL